LSTGSSCLSWTGRTSNRSPFTERDSHYLAVGTAFVIDHDRFVTAAHVIAAGIGG